MKRILLAIVLIASHADAGGTTWGNHKVWDDGLAEVAVYDATRTVYGAPRSYETVIITVKEDLDATYHVKADPPYEGKQLIGALKMNIVSEIQTDNYPYRYLTSVFVGRNDVNRLIKMTVGSQEWCGNTFKLLKTWDDQPELAYHSYWDGQGDGSYPLDWDSSTLAEDQLVLSLRSLPFTEGYTRSIRLFPTQITNKASRPDAVPARVRVVGREDVAQSEARSSCWRVEVTGDGFEQAYWFSEAFPNILVKYRSSDGRSLDLKAWERRTYW